MGIFNLKERRFDICELFLHVFERFSNREIEMLFMFLKGKCQGQWEEVITKRLSAQHEELSNNLRRY